eukprot:7071039-Ditylum_brightwellii.AAC.1
MLQETIQDEITQPAQTQESFSVYIEKQPAHIKQLSGTLQASEVDVDYWIGALNNGSATIATDGSVADQKGYFATVFHTDNRTIWLQGPCDGAKSLMTSYCTKLIRILAALYLLHALSQYSSTPTKYQKRIIL